METRKIAQDDSNDQGLDPAWLDAEMLLTDGLTRYVEDRIEEAKEKGISLQSLFCVLVMSIDQAFTEKAPEIDGPDLLMEMALNREAARGA